MLSPIFIVFIITFLILRITADDKWDNMLSRDDSCDVKYSNHLISLFDDIVIYF